MKTHEEIDQLIRQALSAEEAKFYNELAEQDLTQMVGGLFQGKMKWFTIMTIIAMLILFVGAVFCAIRFFQTDNIKEMLVWGAGAFMLFFAVGFLKLFQWMQMEKNAIMREIKRMELQIVALSGKLDKA
ncbi:MAG TPA: hypothetical protein PKW06_14510 [Cyclobacteriaceae bacterium]|nr:hypothetical protein [Cyclobacteriaceae bacterium]MCB9237061.1 hypothetical protein [Flammeovirgaceae bacterium]MCB0500211.1 hypothetical protein [Cyclobacteriaceae bacterium]MCO5271708.1 hypothetical protein [Cyclobacteriaceae bacterium]MCW5901228.1 hypothetical protein [Cyclobacteriaceae bacterium]